MLKRALDTIGTTIPPLLLIIVLLVIPVDVFMRTVLAIPFHAAHEIAMLAFAGVVWFGLIGLAARNELLGVRFFVDRLPPRLRHGAEIISEFSVLVIAGLVLHSGIVQISTSRFTTFLTIGWPKWIVTAGLVTAMTMVILVKISNLMRLLAGRS